MYCDQYVGHDGNHRHGHRRRHRGVRGVRPADATQGRSGDTNRELTAGEGSTLPGALPRQRVLQQAYFDEFETVINYQTNAIVLDGVRAEEIK